VFAYSPIAAHHPASRYMIDDSKIDDHAFWMRLCYSMLDRCNGLLVVTMDGWTDSKGVAMEIKRWAQRHGTGSLFYASPIRVNERWEPRFARSPDAVWHPGLR
jgi:Domain of unknown function (DUF1937)